MPEPCDHSRTQVVAHRDGVDYVRCLLCGGVFEAEDLEPADEPAADEVEEEADLSSEEAGI